jgi:hypothetical protein
MTRVAPATAPGPTPWPIVLGLTPFVIIGAGGYGSRRGGRDDRVQYPNCSLKMRSSRLWPGSNSIRIEIVLSESTSTRRTSRASS